MFPVSRAHPVHYSTAGVYRGSDNVAVEREAGGETGVFFKDTGRLCPTLFSLEPSTHSTELYTHGQLCLTTTWCRGVPTGTFRRTFL